MNPIVREWLDDLFDAAIEEAEAAISNERIWGNGADDDETIDMHNDNAELNEEYIEILKDFKEQVAEM